jgi:hypothetical protein
MVGTQTDFWYGEHLVGDWWGLRSHLEREGISLGAKVVLDGFDNSWVESTMAGPALPHSI